MLIVVNTLRHQKAFIMAHVFDSQRENGVNWARPVRARVGPEHVMCVMRKTKGHCDVDELNPANPLQQTVAGNMYELQRANAANIRLKKWSRRT